MEFVDILQPPDFSKSGKIKSLEQAWADEDWTGSFNLWIIKTEPFPAIIYQQRSSNSSWAPNKLDVSAGGHYMAGEEIQDGLREVKEELGKEYDFNSLISLGRKLNISPDNRGRLRKNILNIFMTIDNSSLDSYQLEQNEVYAILECPIADLIRIHTEDYSCNSRGLNNKKENIELEINKNSFPYNWDNYHFKMALLAKRFLAGEEFLLY